MDRLDSMQIFVRVAQLGSFSAVARQMDVARSVVTRQVAALEAHLGVKLIARSTRRLTLTAAGESYLQSSREILDLVEVAETGLAEQGGRLQGRLRISVPLSFGLRHLLPLLLDFGQIYPELDIDLDFTDRRVNLIEEGVDLAIRITSRLEPLDVARKIGSASLVVLASPGYLARHGEPQHPADLAQHVCLSYQTERGSGWTFLLEGTPRMFPVGGRMRANNGDALLAAAIRNMGIISSPTFISAPAIEAGQLRPILTQYAMPELGIYAVLPSNRYIPQRVRVCVDYLVARIGSKPYWEQA